MENQAVVRGVKANGDVVFYTGRAGQAWVSADRAEAWTHYNMEGARRFAMQHNKNEILHGIRFVAVSA